MRWTFLLVLAACGGENPATPDAPPVDSRVDASPDGAVDASGDALDLACLGQRALGGAGAMAIAGKVFAVERYEAAPAVGAQVELRRSSDDALVGTATTAADGAFSIDASEAIDGYFVVIANGKLPTHAFSDTPLVAGEDALLLVVDPAELARWYTDAGTTHVSGARTAIVAAVDCARHTANGSSFALDPASTVTYYDDQAKHWDPGLTSSTNGFALLPSAPPSVAVTARVGATEFPAKPIAMLPDTLTIAVISPYD